MEAAGEKITAGKIEDYLAYLAEKGRGDSSLQSYRRILTGLYQYLPGDKTIDGATGQQWVSFLKEHDFSPATINTRISVWNGFLQYLGRREWQMGDFNREAETIQPELSRREYLRLLSAVSYPRNRINSHMLCS